MNATAGGVRIVAVFEAAKGALVLAAGFGLLAAFHAGLGAAAEELVEAFHLNPASRYPRIFIQAAESVGDGRLWLLAAGAMAYALVRFVEAYGLWRARRWAEWFAVASGGLYIPVELYELARGVSWARVLLLAVNVAIVAYMAIVLRRSSRRRAAGVT